MALVSGEQEYSSPAKRIKLDQTQHLSNSNVELDFGTYSAPIKNVHEVIEGQYSVTAEVLSSIDSGYNEMSSASCSDNSGQSGSSGLETTVFSSQKDSSNDVCGDCGKEEEEEEDDDEKDEVSSTVSNLSNLSGLSDLSGQEWKPMAGPMSWVQKQRLIGVNPRNILSQLMGDNSHIPPTMDDLTLWKIIVNILSEPPRRQKLRHVNTLLDVVRLLKGAKKIIVLTGAGVSVSCGIPDFRSRDGIYSRLALDFPDLPDPQAMFDIQYFSQDPRPFFKFAREIYPGQFKPSPCHRFIKMLEKHNKLLRNYSQNIDTLEQVAGIQNVIECHGSFATASCTRCKYKVTADAIRDDIFAQKIPLCPRCSNNATSHTIDNERYSDDYKELVKQGIMKPDIVFFGEGLPYQFHESMAVDKDKCDLLIVIGSSLKVRPVALIPSSVPSSVPQILINREPLPHFNFDVKLLGDSDVIINQLCHMLGDDWSEACWCPEPLVEAKHLLPSIHSRRSSYDNTWNGRHKITGQSSSKSTVDRGPRSKLNIEPPGQAASISSTAAGVMNRDIVTDGNYSPYTGDHGSNVESSEADSLQMSIDSGMGMSADSSSSGMKERHMSVDSSTRDSGVCFSADSPVDNRNFSMIDSSKECSQESTDLQCEIRCMPCGVSSCSSNRNNRDKDSHVDSSLKQSPADSTSQGKQYTVLIDSTSMLQEAEPEHNECCHSPKDSTSIHPASADSTFGNGRVTSSSVSVCASVNNRQLSVDSMRDSGIGDGTNSVDSSASCGASPMASKEHHMSVDSSDEAPKCEDDIEALRACWQPKIRESLASRLPEDSYYFMQPNTYIFPGAEVFYDPDDTEHSVYSGSGSSSSDSSDSGSNASDDSDGEDAEADPWDSTATPGEKVTMGRSP
ncbi:hypothetical protein R5R35_000792 [Gryllus longicercus]|uniref:protein acetyllysine N-acetyltransferase n=1 Tax=Gryllus longicercus TaxID=2509291 RepID=A0AAN9W6M9_9ORTH